MDTTPVGLLTMQRQFSPILQHLMYNVRKLINELLKFSSFFAGTIVILSRKVRMTGCVCKRFIDLSFSFFFPFLEQ